jgi:glycopeptide antibiotics resistance protein
MSEFITFDPLDLLIGLFVLVCLLPLVWRQKRSVPYLLFFSIFWIYLLAVVEAIIFPIVINWENSSGRFTPSINLIPFYFGDCSMLVLCIRGVVENILLTIPFGFGIHFLVQVRPRTFLWLSLTVGLLFELSQLVISLVFRSRFRAVDINDVILNGAGILIGYAIFRVFVWVYLQIAEHINLKDKWLLADLYDVAFRAQAADRLIRQARSTNRWINKNR